MPFSSQAYLEELRKTRPAFYEDALATAHEEDAEHGAWSAVEQFASGFVNGFTTLDVGSDPVSGAERLARSMGNLLGFVGFIPGPGLLGKLSTTSLARGSGLIARTIRGASLMPASLLPSTAFGLPLKSVPMMGADIIMSGLKQSVGKLALADSLKLAGGAKMFGRTLADIAEGGLHLGLASAIGARPIYQAAIDDRWNAFWEGAPAGVAFRLLGNAVNKGGLVDLTKMGFTEPAGRRANAFTRAFSGAALMGLPATLHDEPLELQVYEYLLGSYFGGMEMSSTQRRVLSDLGKYKNGRFSEGDLMNVKKLDEWNKWSPAEQEEAAYQADLYAGRLEHLGIDGFENLPPAYLAYARAKYNSLSEAVEKKGGDYNAAGMELGIHPTQLRRIVIGERLNEETRKGVEGLAKDIAPRSDVRDAEETVESWMRGTFADEAARTDAGEIQGESVPSEKMQRVAEIREAAIERVADQVREEKKEYEARSSSVKVFLDTMRKYAQGHGEVLTQRELEQITEEKGVPSLLRRPLNDVVEGMLKGRKAPDVGPELPAADVRERFFKLAGETLSKEKQSPEYDGYGEFQKRLKSEFAYTVEGVQEQALRQTWNFLKVARPMNLMEWVLGEGMRDLKQVNALGENVENSGAPTPLEGVVGNVLRLSSVRKAKGGEGPIKWMIEGLYRADRDKKGNEVYPWHKVLLWSYMSDHPFVAGYKDDASLNFAESWQPELLNPAERKAAVTEIMRRQQALVVGGREGSQAYEQGMEEWLKRFRDKEGSYFIPADPGSTAKSEPTSEQYLADAFDALWAQNLLVLEKMNGGIPFEEILKAPKKQFVNTWVDFNKRMQVLLTGAIPWDAKSVKIPDVLKHGGLRTVILEATGNRDDTLVWEKERDEMGVPTGYAVQRASETARDGGVYMRRDVFSELLNWAGADPRAGFEKSHQFSIEPGQGAFLSKRGVHMADAELDKWMAENELHMVEFTTTAKQRGNRRTTRMLYDTATGTHVMEHPVSDVAFTLPLDSLRHNPNTAEVLERQLHDQPAVVQLLYNITLAQGGQKAMQDLALNVVLPSWRGTASENEHVDRLLKLSREQQDQVLSEAGVDVDQVDGATILRILLGTDARPSPLWKSLFFQTVSRYAERMEAADSEGVQSSEYNEYLKTVEDIRSAADKLFATWEPTPAVAMNPITRKFTSTVVWSYLSDRVTRPKLANSMKAYMVPHSPFVQQKYFDAGRMEQGTFFLARGAREKVVTYPFYDPKADEPTHREATLGDVWDRSQAGDTAAKDWLAKNFLVVRVPADSASGIRNLKFGGFVEEAEGASVFLHDLDMRNLGGADTDGDSVFIYHGGSVPESVREFYARPETQMEWYEQVETRDGGVVPVMRDASETKDLQQEPTFNSKASRDPLSFGNPLVGLYIGREAAVGNSQLGPGLSLMRSALAHVDMEIRRAGSSARLEDVAKKLRSLKRAIVNGAADASGGQWLLPMNEIRKLVMERSGMSDDQVDRFSKMNAILKGRDPDMNRPYSLFEIAHLLDQSSPPGGSPDLPRTPLTRWERVLEGNRKVVEPYPNLWYFSADVLAKGLQGIETSPWAAIDRGALEERFRWMREFMGETKSDNAGSERLRQMLYGIRRKYLADAPNLQDMEGREVPGKPFVVDIERPENGYTRYGWSTEDRTQFDSLPKYLRDELTLDFIMQDTMDMASAKTLDALWREWTKDAPVSSRSWQESTRLRDQIWRTVNEYKLLERKRQDAEHETAIESGLKPAVSSLEETLLDYQMNGKEGEWVGYRNLSPVQKLYYTVVAGGSLIPQWKSYPEFMREWERGAPKVDPGTFEGKDALEKYRQKGRDEWHARSWNSSGLKMPFIEPEGLRLLGKAFNEFLYAEIPSKAELRRWLTNDEREGPVKRMIGPVADELKENVNADEVVARAEQLHRETAVRKGEVTYTAKAEEPVPSMIEETVTPDLSTQKNPNERAVKDETLALKKIAEYRSSDPKVEAQIEEAAGEMREIMQRYPWMIKLFDGVIEGRLGEMNAYHIAPALDRTTMRQMRTFLNSMRDQKFYGKDAADLKKGLKLPWYAHFLWPEKIDELILPYDTREIALERQMIFTEKGLQEGKLYKLISHAGFGDKIARQTIDAKDNEVNRLRQESTERLTSLYRLPSEVADDFYRYAGRYRERNRDQAEGTGDLYARRWQEALREMNTKHTDTPLSRMEGAKQVPATKEEVLQMAVEIQNEWAATLARVARNDAQEAQLFEGLTDKSGWLDVRGFVGRMTKTREFPKLTWNALKRVSEMQIVLKLPVKIMEGGESKAGIAPAIWRNARPVVADGVRYREVSLGDVQNIAHQQMLYRQLKNDAAVNINGWMNFKEIGLIDPKEYLHHTNWPKKVWEDARKTFVRENAERIEPWKVMKELEMELQRTQSATEDLGIGSYLNEALLSTGLSEQEMIEAGLKQLPNQLVHRSNRGGTVLGWDESPRAMRQYEQQMATAIYNKLYSVIMHETIRDFERDRPMGEHTDAWAAFFRTQVQTMLGAPSVYPREWLDNPDYKIKNSPYYFFTDQYWLDLSRKLGFRFGVKEESLVNKEKLLQDSVKEAVDILYKDLPPDQKAKQALRIRQAYSQEQSGEPVASTVSGVERSTLETTIEGRTLELARKLTDAKMIARFAWLSNLEAKYELMSLLTHVRTAAANMVGGTFNTVISTGFEPWRKAGNYDYMKRTAFQGMDSIQSMADVERFVEQHGGVESFITELSARGVAPQAQMRAFFQEAQGKLTAGKGSVLDRTTLWEIAKKHGLNERFMDMASVFMRQSERAIRRRSWMAHYLKARDVLSVNGVQIEADHPWLIEFAQRGTEASQFLYNNATRPVFARTALGKVFSRFQLWAWNSVKFRNEIFARARIGGFTPGTPEMDKFQRMILADMFVMGLATIFPTSLFGANVPAPWSYFQDLSEWMFGNSKERDKAFYGTLPYPLNITKMVMPPVGRVLDPVFVAMTGNWDRWLDYTVWTYAPFGRLARAGVKVVDNPTMVAENLFGVPLHEWQSRLKKAPQKPLISNVLGPVGVDRTESLTATPPHLRSIPDADFERLEQAYGKLNSMMRDLKARHGIEE